MSYLNKVVRETTVHVIGKCPVKTCTYRKRLTRPGVILADKFRSWTEWGIPVEGSTKDRYPKPSYPVRPSKFIDQNANRFDRALLAAIIAHGCLCAEHDQFLNWREIKGVYNADKTCNGRCVNAHGFDCECSCAGANHGVGYA